jgi:DNA-binding Lrp family transcriptional regulator
MFRCAAYRSLTLKARALVTELLDIHNGGNNGDIGLSVREAAKRCGVSSPTAMGAFDELIEKGFIKRMKPGSFSNRTKLATKWQLTWLPCNVTNALPTKDFMRRSQKWTPRSSQKEGTA